LIANLLHPEEPATFATIERLVPDAHAQSNRSLKRIPRPRIIKTHEYFDHRYPRVVYVVRDPRDVAVSYFYFSRKYRHIQDAYPLERYVDDFVSGRLMSRDWGTWGENLASWLATRRGSPNFLLLRYEDMLEDTARELTRLAFFFGIDATRERLSTAIDRSSAQQMRELEKRQANAWVSTKNRRPDIPFVRTASSGAWKSKLPESSVAAIEATWGPLMTELGYELSTELVTLGN
jgi:hypothetical protein